MFLKFLGSTISSDIRNNRSAQAVLHKCRFLNTDSQNYILSNCLSELPTKAKIVICGGGVMGAAVAYHLAKRGWGDRTLLIEKEHISGGSRWHSSGLLGMFKPSLAQVRLAQSSFKLIQDLENKGHKTGWKQCGSLLLARSRDRMTVFRRMKAQSVSWDIPCELSTPDKCKERLPLLYTDDLIGGLWIPQDGVADANLICLALVKEAIKGGVGVIENCSVTNILTYDDKVIGVDTNQGSVECHYFVNCGGFWARQIGELSEPHVKVPLLPCEHHYLHTKPIENLDPLMPGAQEN